MPADPGRQSARDQFDFLILLDFAGSQRPGDDGAETADAERPVDRQPKHLVGRTRANGQGQVMDGFFQPVDAFAGFGADGDNLRILEEGSCRCLDHFIAHQLDHFRIDQVGFVDDDNAGADAEQTADVEMLAGLRHDRFVGGNHEQDEIDPSDAGQHVFDELFVAGHVHESDLHVAEVEMSESQVDRDAAKLLFLQTVGIDAGQSLDQRAFAVVDMSCRADNYVPHIWYTGYPILMHNSFRKQGSHEDCRREARSQNCGPASGSGLPVLFFIHFAPADRVL